VRLMAVAAFVLVLSGARGAYAQGEDGRRDFEVGLFTGMAIDSFAAKELKNYLNPDESGDVREQLIAGITFAYRLMKKEAGSKRPQMWVYGETIHGTRSGDVDCSDESNAQTETCQIAKFENPGSSAALAIFREATSLEGFFGLQIEFVKLRGDSDSATAMLYGKVQAGFLTTADNGGDIVDIHHLGTGLTMINGPFQGSYVEVGVGRNDLFQKRWPRAKIDAFLTVSPQLKSIKDGVEVADGADKSTKVAASAVRPFLQIVIDPDLASGPDSIQTFFGLDVDLLEVFKK
jgi:hypothetical protein